MDDIAPPRLRHQKKHPSKFPALKVGLPWGCGSIWEQFGTWMREGLAESTGTGFPTNQLLEGEVTFLPVTNFHQNFLIS